MSSRRIAAALLVAVACTLGCGGSVSPTEPTPVDPSPVLPSPDPVPATPTVSGRATSVLDDSPLPGVLVEFSGGYQATTDETGTFGLDLPIATGVTRVTLSSASVVTRQTSAWLPAAILAFSLIPASFDAVAFDQFARSMGDGALIRWNAAPALRVETSLVATPGADNVALAEQIPNSEVDRLVARLSMALPLLSGGRYPSFSTVARQTTPAGQPIGMYTRGVITVVYYTERNGACGQGGPGVASGSLEVVTGAMWLRVGCATLGDNTTTMVHELGHALGYGHVTSTPSVMKPSGGVDVTAFDLAAARIAFQRTPGNIAPDTDPAGRTPDAAARSTGGRVVIKPPLP